MRNVCVTLIPQVSADQLTEQRKFGQPGLGNAFFSLSSPAQEKVEHARPAVRPLIPPLGFRKTSHPRSHSIPFISGAPGVAEVTWDWAAPAFACGTDFPCTQPEKEHAAKLPWSKPSDGGGVSFNHGILPRGAFLSPIHSDFLPCLLQMCTKPQAQGQVSGRHRQIFSLQGNR